MIWSVDKDTPCLHLIYDMWDTMIKEVRSIIFKHEDEDLLAGHSSFYYYYYYYLCHSTSFGNQME